MTQDPIRLFRLRVKAGLTQEQLAHAAGLVKSTVSRLERGLVSAEVSTLHALAAALGVSVDKLMPDEPVPAGGTSVTPAVPAEERE